MTGAERKNKHWRGSQADFVWCRFELRLPRMAWFAQVDRPVADDPYQGAFGLSLLRYRYRSFDANHQDNAGLRERLRRREPLIYFHEVTVAFQVPLAEVTRQRPCVIRSLL